MRRWVLITLLLLLPLQWMAAAQAGFCDPRCGCATEHSTEHAPASSDSPCAHADGTPASPTGCDSDCPACQVHALTALVSQGPSPSPFRCEAGDSGYSRHIAEHVPHHLLRPPMHLG